MMKKTESDPKVNPAVSLAGKYIVIAISATVLISTLWGAFSFIDSKFDKDKDQSEVLSSIEQRLDNIEIGQTVIINTMDSLSKDVEGVKDNMFLMGDAFGGLKDSYVKFVKDNTRATNMFMEYMEGVLYEKKKPSRTPLIPFSN